MKYVFRFTDSLRKLLFPKKKYVSVSDEQILRVNFKYKKALEELRQYDAGDLKGVDLSSGIKSLQDYFEQRKAT